ncbi:CNT_collapsed_G0015950.mRNA.1.CDS.1 [Saccharomyces cerevisiae]|nr:CNT_collapsed_G0015950.mRNA.1.CDS.1 [Saccharomyces cerevisiae]
MQELLMDKRQIFTNVLKPLYKNSIVPINIDGDKLSMNLQRDKEYDARTLYFNDKLTFAQLDKLLLDQQVAFLLTEIYSENLPWGNKQLSLWETYKRSTKMMVKWTPLTNFNIINMLFCICANSGLIDKRFLSKYVEVESKAQEQDMVDEQNEVKKRKRKMKNKNQKQLMQQHCLIYWTIRNTSQKDRSNILIWLLYSFGRQT